MKLSRERARDDEHWQLLASRARSFRWASAFLSPMQRSRVAALYAFCRAVDDLADAHWVTPECRQDLTLLEAALAAERRGDGEALWPPQYLWFRELCLGSRIDFAVVQELLRGMSSDLGLVRLGSDEELLRYCYRAAGTVGLMMCSVLGVRDPQALRHAVDLGIAMQLTNISRDVLEDAQAQRVYLPADRLASHGVDAEQLVRGEADPKSVSLVVDEVLSMADDYYRSGEQGIRFLPLRARWAILVASRLYRGIGHRLRRRYQSNPLLGRVVVPWFAKLGLVLSATATWLRSATRPKRPVHRQPPRDERHSLPSRRG